jgi:hypothetical protein
LRCRWGSGLLARIAVLVATGLLRTDAQTLNEVCAHQEYDEVGSQQELPDGVTQFRDIRENQTHRWYFRLGPPYNVSVMDLPDAHRKLLINLEPCRGMVYLFVRKTRPCYPDPYSCVERRKSSDCTWTHFMSQIDGSVDGTATFFELPLTSTRYFISVYARTNAQYTLTALTDMGAFPRPGGFGRISAVQLRELQVQLSWDVASYFPAGITDTKQYSVYSSLLLENDNRTNMAVFMRPDKIMNTVCGLENNTDRQELTVTRAQCGATKCNATLDGIIMDKRYVFNVVVESERGYRMAYSGLIMRTDWEVVRQAASDKTLQVVGAVSGSVLGMVVILYFLMLKMYG